MDSILRVSILAAVALVGCGKSAAPPAAVTATAPMPAPTSVLNVEMHVIDVNGVGAAIGTVQVQEGPAGLVFTPDLTGLSAGLHGFHIHQNSDCGAKSKEGKMTPGEAAGPHYDPANTGKHAGPDGMGHAGDLPKLQVTPDGQAKTAVTAARLKLADVRNHSLMIHADDDNYSDSPGGARIACGVVK
jgi:Cu-Zn family superoxide dismutase